MRGSTLHAICKSYDGHEGPAELRDAHKCGGDITNHEGKLQCVPIRRMEKR
jgi:hypothetical protein